MNRSKRYSAEENRHRLLEGVLLRLARLPHADQFVLRGGMLMRHWFRPLPRVAGDLDLVSTFAFNVEDTRRRFIPLLADRHPVDGVTFDCQRFKVEGIWTNTDFPGVRIFAAGEVDGREDSFSVDVTFGEPLVPEPELGEYPTLCGQIARIWMCRPETITGRKLHALMHTGMLHWRPKDLNDLRLLLGRVPMKLADLPAAIAASFTSRGNAPAEARAVFARDSWWKMKASAARWYDFVRDSNGDEVPADLGQVVAEVAEKLEPILERLP